MKQLEIIFIGTGGSIPTYNRGPSCTCIRNEGKCYLIDIGEGSQYKIMRSEISMTKITHIFLTHEHGDHINGLFGLLETMNMYKREEKLTILGNKYTMYKIMDVIKVLYGAKILSYEIEYEILCHDTMYHFDDMMVQALEVDHIVPTLSYIFTKKILKGTFDVQKAKDMGIPPGPIYSKLHLGQKVLWNDKILDGKDFICKISNPIKIYFSGDTRYNIKNLPYLQNMDVMIHEATYCHINQEIAHQKYHSTTTDAAKLAKLSHSKCLILNHIVARTVKQSLAQYENQILQEARKIHSCVYLAKDLDTYLVSESETKKI